MKDFQPNKKQSVFAIMALVIPVVYGLMIRPLVMEQSQWPLEIVFLFASLLAIGQLFTLGFKWQEIQQGIADKLHKAIPTLLILFAIGLLIGTWMISGTIPSLVYWGLKIIAPEHLYFFAFVVPILFSVCTGTSWGSIATIGLVIITIAQVTHADLAITAGAIIGGAYFGDKMSPLSDTTNIAAVATGVDLYDHIRSMTYTTIPAALLAGSSFFVLDFIYPAELSNLHLSSDNVDLLVNTMAAIEHLFVINGWTLIPPVIIVIGAIKRQPSLPTLVVSSLVACVIALTVQQALIDDVIQTIYKGFDTSMALHFGHNNAEVLSVPTNISALFNRGGLYALHEPIVITILVFIYVASISLLNAIPFLIKHIFHAVKRKATLVASSLLASALTNALTSSQYANSFIVSQAFFDKYHELGVSKRVLSRTLEDSGTMVESLVPWSTTSVFIFASLGVSVYEYWHWQLLSLVNITLAFAFAYLGFAIFSIEDDKTN